MTYDIDLTDLENLMTPKGWESLKVDSRYLLSYGGSGSSKSYSTAQKIIYRILTENNHRFLIARKTARSLKRSVFQLLRDVISSWGLNDLFTINLTDLSFVCKANHNQIILSGLDDVEKLKSIAGITSLWIEEASEITLDDFTQLDLRLRGHTENYKQIILTFNPTNSQSWLKKRFFDYTDQQATVIHSTYKDNQFIDNEYKNILQELAGQNKNMHDIYSLGLWGNREGLIYTDYEIIEELPNDYEFRTYGLDFGFNHPMALVETRTIGNNIYTRERYFKSHTQTADIISFMNTEGISKDSIIYCDSANPDKIQMIQNAGYRKATMAKKDVLAGIDFVKSKKLHVTKDSVNLIKELESYSWQTDKNGNSMEKPVKLFDDLLDGLRYSIFTGEKIKISLAMVGAKKNNGLNMYGTSIHKSFKGY